MVDQTLIRALVAASIVVRLEASQCLERGHRYGNRPLAPCWVPPTVASPPVLCTYVVDDLDSFPPSE
jgi:hypothetical protein